MSKKNEEEEKVMEDEGGEEEKESEGEEGKDSPRIDFSRFQGLPGASHSMCGWLQKKISDGKGEGWRLFWFTFDETRGKLHFSPKENGASIGFLGLHLLTAVGLALPHTRKKRNPQRFGHEFHIITNHRPYYFAAETNKVAKEWVEELTRWRKRNEGKITRYIRNDETVTDDQGKKKSEYQLANALTTAINREDPNIRRPSVLSLNSKQLFVEDYCHHLVQAYQQIRQQDDQFREALVSIFSLRKQVNVLATKLRETQRSRQDFEGEVIQELKRSREDLLSTRNRLAHTKQILGVTYRSLENVTENETKLQNSYNLAKQRILALEQRLSTLPAIVPSSSSPSISTPTSLHLPTSLHPQMSPNPPPPSPLATPSPSHATPSHTPVSVLSTPEKEKESEKEEICYPPSTRDNREGEKTGKVEEEGEKEGVKFNEEGGPIVAVTPMEGSRSLKDERRREFHHGGEGDKGPNRFMNLLNQSLRFFDKEKEQSAIPHSSSPSSRRRPRSSSSASAFASSRPESKGPRSLAAENTETEEEKERKGEEEDKDQEGECVEEQVEETVEEKIEEGQLGEQAEEKEEKGEGQGEEQGEGKKEETVQRIKKTQEKRREEEEGIQERKEEGRGRRKPWRCGTCLHFNLGGGACAVCWEPCPMGDDDSSDEDLTDRLVLLSNKKHNSFEENWISSSSLPPFPASAIPLPPSPSSPSLPPPAATESKRREGGMDGGQEKEEERKEGGEGGRRGEECGYSDGLSSLSALSFEKQCSPLSLSGEVINPEAPYVQIPTQLYMEWADDRKYLKEQLEKLKGMVEQMRKMQT